MNAYELMKEFYDLDNEILELVNKKIRKMQPGWTRRSIQN